MSNGGIGDLGWRGKYQYDSPEVVALREQLQAEVSTELEIVDPAQPGFAQRAAELFHRDGYVLVRDVLDDERLERVREGCAITVRAMMEHDPQRVGSRGSHRYTFGGAPMHFGCAEHWASLIDPPATLAVLEAIFGGDTFQLQGIGGDFVRASRSASAPLLLCMLAAAVCSAAGAAGQRQLPAPPPRHPGRQRLRRLHRLPRRSDEYADPTAR